MKKILFLTFYFKPDLGAGSFRSESLLNSLSQNLGNSGEIHLITTMPNRYQSFKEEAKSFEELGNVKIHRIDIGKHQNGFIDQVLAYRKYFSGVKKITNTENYDIVFVTSQRLFSSYLGMLVAKKNKCPLYLDIRDLFRENITEIITNKFMTYGLDKVLAYFERKAWSNATHINLVSAGFMGNFKKYTKPNYTYYTNGIDNEFIGIKRSDKLSSEPIKILYAGNIGEGQGLEKIIPPVAEKMGNNYQFLIIGDGSTKQLLINALAEKKINNVQIIAPINRSELKTYYENVHILFLHLNNYKAFEKVLPSKIFEYAASNQPLLAGVSGYSAKFLKENVDRAYVFNPCDENTMIEYLKTIDLSTIERKNFINNFNRQNISNKMAENILAYLK
jgi:hypothetical protein